MRRSHSTGLKWPFAKHKVTENLMEPREALPGADCNCVCVICGWDMVNHRPTYRRHQETGEPTVYVHGYFSHAPGSRCVLDESQSAPFDGIGSVSVAQAELLQQYVIQLLANRVGGDINAPYPNPAFTCSLRTRENGNTHYYEVVPFGLGPEKREYLNSMEIEHTYLEYYDVRPWLKKDSWLSFFQLSPGSKWGALEQEHYQVYPYGDFLERTRRQKERYLQQLESWRTRWKGVANRPGRFFINLGGYCFIIALAKNGSPFFVVWQDGITISAADYRAPVSDLTGLANWIEKNHQQIIKEIEEK